MGGTGSFMDDTMPDALSVCAASDEPIHHVVGKASGPLPLFTGRKGSKRFAWGSGEALAVSRVASIWELTGRVEQLRIRKNQNVYADVLDWSNLWRWEPDLPPTGDHTP